MNEREAREKVVSAGKRLVSTGLIARTWGNVSCRISDSHFAATPSGRGYLTLTPEETVVVSIENLSYEGSIKPTSEKRIHAEIYKHNKDINFVIHTHQKYASVLSAMGLDSINTDFSVPGNIACASYALPGTKKLSSNIRAALNRSYGNAIIMKNHGAICFGQDEEEAFQTAKVLEDACKDYITKQYYKAEKEPNLDSDKKKELEKIKQSLLYTKPPAVCNYSRRTDNGFTMKAEGEEYIYVKHGETGSFDHEDARIHNEIYLKHKNINYIIHTYAPDILNVSSAGITLYPMLDDFAQIVGTKVETVINNPVNIAGALKNSSAVLVKNKGALCCAASKDDASAIEMILEKNCIIQICKALFKDAKPLSRFDSMLMRFIYLKKYSKKMNEKGM